MFIHHQVIHMLAFILPFLESSIAFIKRLELARYTSAQTRQFHLIQGDALARGVAVCITFTSVCLYETIIVAHRQNSVPFTTEW